MAKREKGRPVSEGGIPKGWLDRRGRVRKGAYIVSDGPYKKASPPTEEEFLQAVSDQRISARLNDFEARVRKIQDDPDNIRNTPDVRYAKDIDAFIKMDPDRDINTETGAYVTTETDLDDILDHIAAIWEEYQSGDMRIVECSMESLDARIRAVERRRIKPTIDRNLEIARQCLSHPKWHCGKAGEAAAKRQVYKNGYYMDAYSEMRFFTDDFSSIHPFRKALNQGLKERSDK